MTVVRIDELTGDEMLYAFDVTTSTISHTNLTSLERIRQLLGSSRTATTSQPQSLIQEIDGLTLPGNQHEINGFDVCLPRRDTRPLPVTMPSAISRFIATDIQGRAFHLRCWTATAVISFLDDL